MADRIAGIFDTARVRGFVHAREIDGDAETGLDPGEPVVTASVFKITVLLELARQAAAGELELTQRVRIDAADRTIGPTGLSVMLDDVDMSLRDLAFWMMSVSDNTATDVAMRYVGLDRINATLAELGIGHTKIVGDCRELLGTFSEDTGIELSPGFRFADADPDALRRWRSIDPAKTSSTTPSDMTRLLKLVWTDKAGPPEACAEVRRIMALQVWPHRLTSGFPDGVRLAAKTGTLPGIRNEVGVVTYLDGKQYAVAVFTKAETFVDRQPEVDAAIGRAAFSAVESLRA